MKHNAKGVLIGFVVGMTLAAGAAYAMEAITAPHAASHAANTADTVAHTHPRSSVSTPTPGPVAGKEVAHKAKKAATAQKKRHTQTSKKLVRSKPVWLATSTLGARNLVPPESRL